MSETEGMSLPVQAETNPLSSLELEVPEVQALYEKGTNLIAQRIQEGTLKPEQASNSSLRTAIENQHHALLAVVQEKNPDLKAKGVHYDPQTQEFSYLPLDQVNQEKAQPIKGQTDVKDTLDCLAAIRDLDVPEDVKTKARQHLEALKTHALIEDNGQKTTVAAYEEKVGKLPEEAEVSLVGKPTAETAENPAVGTEFENLDSYSRILLERLANVRPNALPRFYEMATDPEIYKDPRAFLVEYRKLLSPNPQSELDQRETAIGLYKHLTGEEAPRELTRNPDLLLWKTLQDEKVQESLKEVAALFPDGIIDKAKVNMDWFTNTNGWERFNGTYKKLKPSTGKLFLFLMLFQYVNQAMEQE
jgi:hypothetical protein